VKVVTTHTVLGRLVDPPGGRALCVTVVIFTSIMLGNPMAMCVMHRNSLLAFYTAGGHLGKHPQRPYRSTLSILRGRPVASVPVH
jgi:hypothetical protein